MEQSKRTFAVTEGVVSALLSYLGQKPHNEVAQLVAAFSAEIRAQLTPAELGQQTAPESVQQAS